MHEAYLRFLSSRLGRAVFGNLQHELARAWQLAGSFIRWFFLAHSGDIPSNATQPVTGFLSTDTEAFGKACTLATAVYVIHVELES